MLSLYTTKDFSGLNRAHAKQARAWRDEAVKEVKSAAENMR